MVVIKNPITDEWFDAPTPDETEKRYFGNIDFSAGIECRCGWAGLRGYLTHEIDLEIMHPANRDNPRCTYNDRSGCHYTAFEKCPKCKRCLFADDRFIG